MIITACLRLLFWMLVAHSLLDYALQGDFMARAKNHVTRIPGVPWQWPLLSHALIHAGAVVAITRSYTLGAFEFACHAAIDWGKNDGDFGYTTDQVLHILCKILWITVWACIAF